MNESITIYSNLLCECPFCRDPRSLFDPKVPMYWIKKTPCDGLYKCERCGALLIRGFNK